MERIIKFALIRFADSQHLIIKRQHGFLHRRSCLTNLLKASEQGTRASDKKAVVDVIYFDFKKVFDCVPHLRMLRKPNELGICGWLHSWIQSFLTERPVLFLLFINDCLNGLSCDVADDVKIWRTIESQSDVQSLQNGASYLSSWSQYHLNGEHLRSVSHQRDLGVLWMRRSSLTANAQRSRKVPIQ